MVIKVFRGSGGSLKSGRQNTERGYIEPVTVNIRENFARKSRVLLISTAMRARACAHVRWNIFAFM